MVAHRELETPVLERMSLFQDYLRRLMDERGITASQIAAYAGVSRSTVNYWLRGVSRPTAESVAKLADALGVRYEVLRDIADGRPIPVETVQEADVTITVDQPGKAPILRRIANWSEEKLRRLEVMGRAAFEEDMTETRRRVDAETEQHEGAK